MLLRDFISARKFEGKVTETTSGIEKMGLWYTLERAAVHLEKFESPEVLT